MEVKTRLKLNLNETKDAKFMCLILNTKGTKNSFNGQILGLTLAQWVKFACGEMPFQIIDFDRNENMLDVAKKHIDMAFDYTLVLSSFTPLLTHSTIENIQNYCVIKNVNLCKLHMGYVVKNEYLSKCDKYFVDSVFSDNMDEFYVVENKSQYLYAFSVLNERIINFHQYNGVEFDNPKNTYIEPFVDIDGGVKVGANNYLKGNTKIESNVVLKENNVIENSKIARGSCISHSNILDSVLAEDVFVGSFSEIKNSLIGKNSIIENNCGIYNYNMSQDSLIKSGTNLGENNDSNSRTW